MADQEALDEAHDEIKRAIQAYYDVSDNGDYVTGWVLVTERTSISLAQANQSVVGVLVQDRQSFVTTRGLMTIAQDNQRHPRAGDA